MLNSAVPEMPNVQYPFDVIVVLGAAQKSDGTPGPAMIRRVRHGVLCLKDNQAPYILMAGGCTKTGVPESQSMMDLALKNGVSSDIIFQDNRSKSTLENAIECRAIMAKQGWVRALLITDKFHMPRALYTFRALGIEASPEPNDVPANIFTLFYHCREWVARMVYPRAVKRYLAEIQ